MIDITYTDSIDSTNTQARRLLSVPEGSCPAVPFIIAAREQTVGRGRCGKSFFSPRGGIYMTLVLDAKSIPSDTVTLTCRTGIAVSKTIDEIFSCRTGIKWVNDIYLDGKKICGILCEAVSGADTKPAYIIIGIGINVSTTLFPDDIKNTAGSISKDFDGLLTPEFIKETAVKISQAVIDHLSCDYNPIADYKARSVVLGHRITYTNGDTLCPAKAVDIDNLGGLIVIDEATGQTHTLSSGEITLRVTQE